MSSDSPPFEDNHRRGPSNDAEIDEEGGACDPVPAVRATGHSSTNETRHDNEMGGDGHRSTSPFETTGESTLAVSSEESSGDVSAQVEAGAQGDLKPQVGEAGLIDLNAASGGGGTVMHTSTDLGGNAQPHVRAHNESENDAVKHLNRSMPPVSKRTTALTSHSSMATCGTATEHLLAPPSHRPRIKSIRDGAHADHRPPRGSLSNAEAASGTSGVHSEQSSGRSDVDGRADEGSGKFQISAGGDHIHEPIPFAEVQPMALQLPGAVRVHPSSVIAAESVEDELSPSVGSLDGQVNDNPSEVIHHRQDDEVDDATVARQSSSTAIVEASLVTEPALVEASLIDEEQLQTLSSQAEVKAILTRQARKRRRLWIAIIVLATLVVILAVGISVGLVAGVQEGRVSQEDDETYLRSVLPTSTLVALEDPGSPQYQALQWVLDDVYLVNLDLDDEEKHERLKQRFALAVLFYAVSSGAPGQPTVGNWLIRDTSECGWHGCNCSGEQRIQELSVRDYDLIGYIPPEIGLLDQLVSVDGGNTSLYGRIPTEFAALTRLSDLRVDQTLLSGTIPSELGLLTGLKVLYLHSTEITGTTPSNLGALTNLKILRIDDTQLNGTLPTELGQLTSLTYMSVKSNSIGGTIPTELGRLTSLAWLELHETWIRGTVPNELCSLVGSAALNISITCVLVSCDCGCACGSDLFDDESLEALADDDSVL
jgi:hypothetical protein